jgi:hypothetical protein
MASKRPSPVFGKREAIESLQQIAELRKRWDELSSKGAQASNDLVNTIIQLQCVLVCKRKAGLSTDRVSKKTCPVLQYIYSKSMFSQSFFGFHVKSILINGVGTLCVFFFADECCWCCCRFTDANNWGVFEDNDEVKANVKFKLEQQQQKQLRALTSCLADLVRRHALLVFIDVQNFGESGKY